MTFVCFEDTNFMIILKSIHYFIYIYFLYNANLLLFNLNHSFFLNFIFKKEYNILFIKEYTK